MPVLGRSLAALLGAVLLAAVPLTVVPIASPGALGVAQAAPGDSYARAAHRATNRERAAADLPGLRKNRCLARYAASQAEAMAAEQEMYHQDLEPVMQDCRLSFVGENVALGYRSGRAVVRGWMGSPGHRDNILRPEFGLMAVAARKGADGRWYAAQVFGRR